MPEKKTSSSLNDPTFNFLKAVWRFMRSRESVSQPELRNHICELKGTSQTTSYFIVLMLCKPIQIGYELKGNVASPKFVQEPLIVEMPSLDQSKRYVLEKYWRDSVEEDSDIFEKAKGFYQ